jgi:hypothetical protein
VFQHAVRSPAVCISVGALLVVCLALLIRYTLRRSSLAKPSPALTAHEPSDAPPEDSLARAADALFNSVPAELLRESLGGIGWPPPPPRRLRAYKVRPHLLTAMVNAVLDDALRDNASGVVFESYPPHAKLGPDAPRHRMGIAYRTHLGWREVLIMPHLFWEPLRRHLCKMAGLRPDIPKEQTGALPFPHEGQHYQFMASFTPDKITLERVTPE